MARNIQLEQLRDFTGGLNLRADPFTIGKNESPDLVDVNVDPRGGFATRNGTSYLAGPYSLGGGPFIPEFTDAWVYYTSASARVVTGTATNTLVWSTDLSGTVVDNSAVLGANFYDAVQMGDTMYLHSYSAAPVRYGPAGFAAMTVAGYGEYTAPVSGRMPQAKAAAVFHNHYFVGHTYEAAVQFGSRIRFSHPGYADRWRTDDWIDVDPKDGDHIVALTPFQDALLVFKQQSLQMLVGFGWDSWQLQPVAQDVGTVSPHTVCVTPNGVYFWSFPHGLMRWNGRTLESVFDRLQPLIDEGTVSPSRDDEIRVSHVNGRVWVTLPEGTDDKATYVYDPTVGKDGTWVKYSLAFQSIFEVSAVSGTRIALGILTDATNYSWLVNVDDSTVDTDQLTYQSDGVGGWEGGPTTVLPAYYQTRWIDGGNAAARKRWRRVRHVVYSEGTTQLMVQAYRDYDPSGPATTFFENVIGAGAGIALYDDVAVYDSTDVYVGDAEKIDLSVGSPLGVCNAVSLRYSAVNPTSRWGVDAILLPYTPKKIR